ncbi:hypothetical protein BDV98DRAFT_565639 [Pterulicium gracile]|uniref:Uncharacterized protein n=1 Tax=Pterulicium gracile TaxID=1884261 RepID=A0A5C3QLW6_9AGAR|nr:hypothetical protein BDV98DRAFT_565639 [Pterula gracilis]
MFQSYSLFTVNRAIQRSSSHTLLHAAPCFVSPARRVHNTSPRHTSSHAHAPPTTSQSSVETIEPAQAPSRPRKSSDAPRSTLAGHSDRTSETLTAALQEWHQAEARSDFAQLEAIVVSLVDQAAKGVPNSIAVIDDLLEQLPDSKLPQTTILALLKILHADKHLNRLSLPVTLRFAQLSGLTAPHIHPLRIDMVELLAPVIVRHLHALEPPSGPSLLRYKPPPIVSVCFSLVRQYLNLSSPSKALSVFRALSKTRHIPEVVTRRVDTSSQSFTFIMRVTLVQAGFHWGWRRFSGNVFTDIVRDPATPSSSRESLYGLLARFLESPVASDVSLCHQCIVELHRRPGPTPIYPPQSLIHSFYSAARTLAQGAAAERFYRFTTRPDVLEEHVYATPSGAAIMWLLDRFYSNSKNEHLARQLVSAVVQQDARIPVGDRARFICMAATAGFATQSRALWEKYSTEQGSRAIAGNATVAVRMTKLYTSLIARDAQKVESMQSALSSADPSELPTTEFTSTPTTESSTPPNTLADIEQRRAKIDEYGLFIDNVITLFQAAHSPLEHASHSTLTSLSRIFILRSRFAEAMQTMKLLLQRHEIPDMYDVNVALSALALHDPRTAAKTILLMLEKNLAPTPVTFGTVIHEALLHKDYRLADDVVQLALRQNTQIDLKSLVSLMRSSVNEDVDPQELRENIRRSFSVVKLLGASHIVSSAKMGKYFIGACIRTEEPVSAFEFWKELVMNKVEWNDEEHRVTRSKIESMLEAQQLTGILQPEVVRRMRSLLRGSASPREIPSVGNPSATERG